jgi:hypothetical protein|tara:strand:+ start:177 stop:347 length:171 start_codon:yes stop_codon:yes gene_type:complete
MHDLLVTIQFETINIDPEVLKARIIAAIESGVLTLEDSVRESCEADPETVTVTVLD